jgi:hypothetical protein
MPEQRKQRRADRSRIPQSEDPEVNAFADRYGITPQRALEIIAEAGGNRDRAVEIAERG